MSGTPASYDRGEQLRVTSDANGVLRVDHGSTQIATIKDTLGGGVKVEADGRTWRLRHTDQGWEAQGEPSATLTQRLLRSDRLRIGPHEYTVRKRTVKGLLKLRIEKTGRKAAIRGEILAPPPPQADAHATIALATAALVLDADLSTSQTHSEINGTNSGAAARYGIGMAEGR